MDGLFTNMDNAEKRLQKAVLCVNDMSQVKKDSGQSMNAAAILNAAYEVEKAFDGRDGLEKAESGTFDPSAYPTADGLYTVVLIGAGGSGAAAEAGTGGSAGGMAVLAHLPLPMKPVAVTVGVGGEKRKKTTYSSFAGMRGGSTSFDGFSVPGGEGGLESVSQEATPAVVGIFTAEVGTTEKGADSYFGEGGISGTKKSGTVPGTDGVAGGIGAGGGRAVETDTYSGAGGSGAVIIYGVPRGSLEEIS